MSIEAMKQALEALEEINKLSVGENAICLPAEIDTAMESLRQAIAETEKQKRKCDNCGEFGLCCQQPPLEACVKEFFKYLNLVEESDSGKMFHPITISCCRAMMLEPLNNLLDRMAELSGAERKGVYDL